MSQPIIQPFPFEKLKQFSHEEARLISQLTNYFPASGLGPQFLETFSELLKKYLGSSFLIRYESIFEAPYGKFIAGLPDRFIGMAVSLTPLTKKVIIEIDSDFAFALVDRLLGGPGEAPVALHSLTPLEEGILQFLVVKFLKELSPLTKGALGQLRFDKIVRTSAELSRMGDENETMILMTFRLRLNQTDSYLRLCLPSPLLLEWEKKFPLFSARALPEDSFLESRLKSLEHFRTVVWGEVGYVSLSARELSQIQRGDIVLFDEAYPEFDGKKISGAVRLKLGEESLGGIEGKILDAGSKETHQIQVKQVFNR